MIYPEISKEQQQSFILIWRPIPKPVKGLAKELVHYPLNMIDDLVPFNTFFYLHPETGIIFYKHRDLFGNSNYIEHERMSL